MIIRILSVLYFFAALCYDASAGKKRRRSTENCGLLLRSSCPVKTSAERGREQRIRIQEPNVPGAAGAAFTNREKEKRKADADASAFSYKRKTGRPASVPYEEERDIKAGEPGVSRLRRGAGYKSTGRPVSGPYAEEWDIRSGRAGCLAPTQGKCNLRHLACLTAVSMLLRKT